MKKAILLLLSLLLLVGPGKAAFAASVGIVKTPMLLNEGESVTPDADPATYIAQAKEFLSAGETAENLAAALDAYLKAVELNGGAEAILGVADVYIRQGAFDDALAYLKAYEDLADEAIQAKIAELDSGNVNDSAGKVRKLFGTAENGPAYVHVYDYDEQDRLSRVTWYDESGVEQDHVDILYDAQGRKLTDADYVLSSSWAGRLIHNEYVYDDQDRMISAKRTLPGEWTEETLYFFDEQGRVIRWETYENETLQVVEIFEDFTERNDPQKRSTYYVEGGQQRLHQYHLIEYDYSAYTKKDTVYDAEGTLKSWTEQTYSSDWKTVLHWVSYASDGSIEYEIFAEQGE